MSTELEVLHGVAMGLAYSSAQLSGYTGTAEDFVAAYNRAKAKNPTLRPSEFARTDFRKWEDSWYRDPRKLLAAAVVAVMAATVALGGYTLRR